MLSAVILASIFFIKKFLRYFLPLKKRVVLFFLKKLDTSCHNSPRVFPA